MGGDRELAVLAWPEGAEHELNPYVRMMYRAFVPPAARILAFKPLMRRVPAADVFHLQWPESIVLGAGGGIPPLVMLKARRVLRTADRVRRHGGIVALTAHNVESPITMVGWQRRLCDAFLPRLLARTDLLIGLSQSGLALFRDAYPRAAAIEGRIVPHPHYRDSYRQAPDAAGARRDFGLAETRRVIGMLGSLRPSKRVPEAIAAFRDIARPGERLLVAGACEDADLWRDIAGAATGDPRVHVVRGRLSDADLARAFAAIDVCLINQASTLNSGTALLSLSFDTPVAAPAVGALPELAAMVGSGWMSLMPVPLSPGDLRAALDALDQPRGGRCEALDRLAPDILSAELLGVFRDVLARR